MYTKIYDSLPDDAVMIRTAVFMDEQGFTDEFDDIDNAAVHIVTYTDSGEPIANCRVYKDADGGYIFGRLAVMPEHRGCGVGADTVRFAEKYLISKGAELVSLHAQCRASGFYKKLGYEQYGYIEYDEGCPHIWMRKSLRITIRKAEISEFTQIKSFYDTVIDDLGESASILRWAKDVYPDGEYLKNAIERHELYSAMLGSEIVGAMILNHDDGYGGAPWSVTAKRNEVTVLHTLAVSSKYSRCGIGTKMVRFAIDSAKNSGQKTIRLDVIAGNFSAMTMYERLGFKYVVSMELFYESTGLCSFELYEYEL